MREIFSSKKTLYIAICVLCPMVYVGFSENGKSKDAFKHVLIELFGDDNNLNNFYIYEAGSTKFSFLYQNVTKRLVNGLLAEDKSVDEKLSDLYYELGKDVKSLIKNEVVDPLVLNYKESFDEGKLAVATPEEKLLKIIFNEEI